MLKTKWKEFKILFETIISGTVIFTLMGIITVTMLGIALKYFDWLFSVLRLW